MAAITLDRVRTEPSPTDAPVSNSPVSDTFVPDTFVPEAAPSSRRPANQRAPQRVAAPPASTGRGDAQRSGYRPATGLTILARPGAAGAARLPRTGPADSLDPSPLDGRGIAQLDHACSTPPLVAADQLLAKAVVRRHELSAAATVARFVGARGSDRVVFTRTPVDAMSLLANVVPAGTTIVVLGSPGAAAALDSPGHIGSPEAWPEADHDARSLPVVRIGAPSSWDEALRALDEVLVSRSTPGALVVVPGACTITGAVWPLQRVVATARLSGARVALEASPLLAHRRVGMAALGVDYLTLSGNTLYAPGGPGALVGRADWLDAAEVGIDGLGPNQQDELRRSAVSGEVTRGIGALAAACAQLDAHWPAIEAHEHDLTTRLVTGLEAITDVDVLSGAGAGDRVGIVSFTLAGWPSEQLAASLVAKHSVGVGSVGAGPGTGPVVRASIGLGTTAEHVERLLDAVASLAGQGPESSPSTSKIGCRATIGT